MPKNSTTATSKTLKKTPVEPTAATTHEASAPAAEAPELTARQQMLLARLSPAVGISAAELAAAADLGRSTAQHDLVALEAAGLARREKGVQEGARRSPDQWFSACTAGQAEPADAPAAPSPEPDTTVTDPADAADAAVASEPAADTTATVGAPDEDTEEPAAVPVATETPDADVADDASARGDAATAPGPETAVAEEEDSADEAPVPEPDAEAASSSEAQTQPTPPAATEKTTERLGKGALRALVEQYLRAHPADDFTPTRIGKDLDRSAGAVSNALDKLVAAKIAEQTSVTPRKFRIAPDAPAPQASAA